MWKFSDVPLLTWKFAKFVLSYLKPPVRFSLNFASLFSIMRHASYEHFLLKLYMIWIKGAHRSANFQTFDCSSENSLKLHFDGQLKVYKVSAKKVQRSYGLTLMGSLCPKCIKYELKKCSGVMCHGTEQ